MLAVTVMGAAFPPSGLCDLNNLREMASGTKAAMVMSPPNFGG
jgi:hypothetical protein